ncbi:hypothetical protein FRC07_008352, partial [Ceratobasidium sp. 392]
MSKEEPAVYGNPDCTTGGYGGNVAGGTRFHPEYILPDKDKYNTSSLGATSSSGTGVSTGESGGNPNAARISDFGLSGTGTNSSTDSGETHDFGPDRGPGIGNKII